jgi:hypothetical protein
MKFSTSAANTSVLFLSLMTGAGCGTQTYETRLASTRAYFEYRQRIDTALESRPWSNFGIELRVPRGFREMPGPGEEDSTDPRQPFRSPLPGLLGAWEGEVEVDIPESDVRQLPAYIYVCSNHQLYLDRQETPDVVPLHMLKNVGIVLAEQFNLTPDSAVEPWPFWEERVPQGTAYVPTKTYDMTILEESHKYEALSDPLPADIGFYRYDTGDIQLAVITIIPHDNPDNPDDIDYLAVNEPIYRELKMMMEVLTMTNEIPRPQNQRATSSGGGF